MHDTLLVAAVVLAFPILIVGGISFALHYFVALRAPPTQRAAWTAGIAYLATTIGLVLNGLGGYELWIPVAVLPAGLLAFFYWRADFRRGWLVALDDAQDGVAIANDDWLIGLLQLLAMIVLAGGIAFARTVMSG